VGTDQKGFTVLSLSFYKTLWFVLFKTPVPQSPTIFHGFNIVQFELIRHFHNLYHQNVDVCGWDVHKKLRNQPSKSYLSFLANNSPRSTA